MTIESTQLNLAVSKTESQFGTGTRLVSETPIKIIIPIYNESATILEILVGVFTTLKGKFNFEVIVIDDGSTDNSLQKIDDSDLPVTVLKNGNNRGKGYSLQRALRVISEEEIVIFMDGDGEHLADDLPRLLKPILNDGADMVVGSRFLATTTNTASYLNNGKQFKQFRLLGNRLFSLFTYLFYQRWLSDTQCGFRAFAPGVLGFVDLRSEGFQVEVEITCQVLKNRKLIKEIPIQNGRVGRASYMNIFRDSLKIIFVLFEQRIPHWLKNKSYLPQIITWIYKHF